jgi:LacI family transcriptional regulator
MADVARRANVSLSAVSYVLNSTRSVGAERRERIRRAMAELGYVPNGTARALRSSKTNLLGMILPDLVNPIYGLLGQGASAVAQAAGYMTVVCTSDDETSRNATQLRALEATRVEGLIIKTPLREEDSRELAAATREPLVYVLHAPPWPEDPADCVVNDDALGVRLALQHLVAHGHRRIGFVSNPNEDRPATWIRRHGYAQGVAEIGLVADPALVQLGLATPAAGERAAEALLDLPDPPTALILANNRQAIGALRAIHRRGLSVPDDLSVVVFGQPEFYASSNVELTMVVQQYPEMGRIAAELLLRRIGASARPARPERVVLKPALQPGESVAAPRVRA